MPLIMPGQGGHPHPHGQDGVHTHPDLPAGGGHAHEGDFGGHSHREGDPIEGFHLNNGNGVHGHPMAQGLELYVMDVVAAHWPRHLWLPDVKSIWIKHIGIDFDFRESTFKDWIDHTLWSMHSAGCQVEAHMDVFLNPTTRFLDKIYILEDGSSRPPTREDFEKECEWLKRNIEHKYYSVAQAQAENLPPYAPYSQ